MSKSETEEMIEIEIDGQEKQACLEEGWALCDCDLHTGVQKIYIWNQTDHFGFVVGAMSVTF